MLKDMYVSDTMEKRGYQVSEGSRKGDAVQEIATPSGDQLQLGRQVLIMSMRLRTQ